jgi:hypothetical protein
MWMRSCAVCMALLHNIRLCDSVRCQCGWIWVDRLESSADGVWPTEGNEIKEVVMAKVIGFYVPKNFRKPLKWAPALHCGTIIEFCSPTKKSA